MHLQGPPRAIYTFAPLGLQEHCPQALSIGRIASFLYFAEDYYKVGLGNAAMHAH